MSDESGAEALARVWIECWNEGTPDRIPLAEDFTHTSPFGRVQGRERYLAWVKPMAEKNVTELRVLRTLARGDEAAIHFEMQTPKGLVQVCDWVVVDGGRITQIHSFYDATELREPSHGRTSMSSPPPDGYPRVTPYLNYEDTGAAMEWLARAFGLVERHSMKNPDGAVSHAEMTLEDGLVMMGSPGGDFRNPRNLGQVTQSLYVYVDDVDSHHDRARAAGAEIIEEPGDQPYGDRRYGAVDPEGHHWYFASRIRGSGGGAAS